MNALRIAALCGFVAAVALAAADAQPPAKQPPPPMPEGHDFVFLAEARPVLVRMHVHVDGQPIQVAWDRFMQRLFAYLDINGDGILDKTEAERAPTLDQLMSGGMGAALGGFFGNSGGGPPTMADLDANKDGKVTLEELAAYYRGKGFEPVQFQGQPVANGLGAMILGGSRREPTVDEIGKAIFDLLDTNKDGKLSREELAAAPQVLLRLDANDDEVLTVKELLPDPPGGAGKSMQPPAMAMGGPKSGTAPKTENTQLIAISKRGQAPENLIRQMQKRYANEDDENLSRDDVGLDQATFAALDANGDGVLDAAELAGFVKRQPDLEVVMRLGSSGYGPAEILKSKKQASPLADLAHAKSNTVFLDLGATRIDLLTGATNQANPLGGIIRQQVVAQFKQMDRAKVGYLTAESVKGNPIFGGMFKGADRDGDGKLYEAEFSAYLDVLADFQERTKSACVTLVLLDQSRGLFDLLDDNRDGRLSVREMRGAVKLLQRPGLKEKGYFSKVDVPRSYRLTLRGGPVDSGNDLGAVFSSIYGGRDASEYGPEPTAGPLWFRKMDRNRDGDVSRKEFLGSDEEFRRIDTDGDGLISVEEAERFDAQFRQKK